MQINMTSFSARIKDAARRREARGVLVQEAIDAGLVIWGYGRKGRVLAAYARDLGISVKIFDMNSSSCADAVRDGFVVVDALPAQGPIVLAATQVQTEISSGLVGRALYFQEVAYWLNMPYLAGKTREFSAFVEANVSTMWGVLQALEPTCAHRFANLALFRVSCDPHDLQETNLPVDRMWFDDAIISRADEINVFLDVGAYDGDTIRSAQSFLGIHTAIGLEMSEELTRRISELHDDSFSIETFNVAAWSHKGYLGESVVGDGMMKVEADLAGIIPCDKIDNLADGMVDFIKMDIEGAEREAIIGADETIRRNRPFMAIAAYHKPGDLVDIFNQMKKYGYRDVRFAHYSQCNDDSIFYFLRD